MKLRFYFLSALFFLSIRSFAQSFPITVKTDWKEAQKTKKVSQYMIFDKHGDTLDMHGRTFGQRNSEGNLLIWDHSFSLDTQTLELNYIGTNKNAGQELGTETFIITDKKLNYSNYFLGTGYNPQPSTTYTIINRQFRYRNTVLEGIPGQLYYIEIEQTLYMLFFESGSLKIIEYSRYGNLTNIIDSTKILNNDFHILFGSEFSGSSKENFRAAFIIEHIENGNKKISLLTLLINLESKRIDFNCDDFSNQVVIPKMEDFYTQVVYMDDDNQKITHLALAFQWYQTSHHADNSSFTYTQNTSLYFLEKKADSLVLKEHFVSSNQNSNSYYLDRFREGYIFFGQGYKDHYSHLSDVDYSETGNAGTFPHLILGYFDGEKTTYKTVKIPNELHHDFTWEIFPTKKSTTQFEAILALYNSESFGIKEVILGRIVLE